MSSMACRAGRLAIAIVTAVTIAGCGTGSKSPVTVIDNPQPPSYEETPATELVRIDDARGTDWLSDKAIIVDKENPDPKTIEAEGQEWSPRNLYVRTIDGGQEKPLVPGEAAKYQGYGLVSPNRTYLFYKTYDLASSTGQGHVLQMASGRTSSFTGVDEIELMSGAWADSRSIVYADLEGTIYRVTVDDTGGISQEKLLETHSPFLSSVVLAGNRLYYTTGKGIVIRYDLQTKDMRKFANKGVWLSASGDGTKLALVRRDGKGGMELTVGNADGASFRTIGRGFQVFGMSWSPDGKRLAYATITTNGTTKGVYVVDVDTGKTTEVQTDVKFIADPIRWSPSGERIMVTSTIPDEKRGVNRFVTYLVAV